METTNSSACGENQNSPHPTDVTTGTLGVLGATKINKAEANDMGGNLKAYVRLNLEADVRVIAKVKGDIVIGIL